MVSLPQQKSDEFAEQPPKEETRARVPHPIRPDVNIAATISEPRYKTYAKALAYGGTLVALTTYRSVEFAARTCIRYLWNHPFHATFNAFVLAILWLVVVTGSEVHQEMILNKISDHTVDAIIDSSRFGRQFESPEVTGGNVREYLGVGAPRWVQREAIRAVLFHARKAGLSIEHQAVLLATVEVESGFNPMAKAATTSACGLFQFVKATGNTYGLAQKDCMNPWLNAEAGIRHYLDNYKSKVAQQVADAQGMEKVFRIYENTYYMHHDGPYYSNPSNDVKAVVLLGTPFLLKTYHVLAQEAHSKNKAPTFGERFAGNLWVVLHQIRSFFGSDDTGPISQVVEQKPPVAA